ncbi:MAG: PAS domain S-box protein [bacterium]|nr:PAS domain S-box protein [bacterium]
MKQIKTWCAFALLFFGFKICLYSQSYLIRTYNITDGLASATVNAIGQDTHGIMWFATMKGVTSYDGTTWINYSGAHGLRYKYYYFLSTGSRGNVWAFSNRLEHGFSCFDGRQWTHVPPPPDTGSRQLEITGTSLMEYAGKFFIGIATRENGFFIYKNPGWHHVNIADTSDAGEERRNKLLRAVAGHHNRFYLATSNGLHTVSPLSTGKPVLKKIDTPSPDMYSIAVKKTRAKPVIWLTGYRWVGYLRGERFNTIYQGDLPGLYDINAYDGIVTFADPGGAIWIGSPSALLKLNPGGTIENFGRQNDLLGDGAYSIFLDREFNLWIGGFRGISKIVSFRFANFRKTQGLFDNEVTAVRETGPGRMIFGHQGGFTFLNGKTLGTMKIPRFNKDSFENFRVLDMDVDPGGNTWAAVNRKGILKISPQRRLTVYTIPASTGFRPHYTSVRAVRGDETTAIWVSIDKDLYTLKSNRLVPVKTDKKMSSGIRRIFKGKTTPAGKWETIFLASSADGLYQLNLKDNKLTQFPADHDKAANSIFAVFTDKTGITWAGTPAGLYTLKNNRLVKFSLPNLQVDSPVYFITGDHNNNLWIGMDRGVIRWSSDRKTVRHFTPHDGLAGHETNRAAGFIDSRGCIWIGTAEGVSRYDKDQDDKPTIAPLMELLYLETSGEQHPLAHPLALKYFQNNITFRFRGISFIDEKALKYHIKLEGYDNNWIRNFKANDNTVRYTNIPPGRYTFHIQAVNGAGIESDIVSSHLITIKKPFRQTPWFYLLILLGVGTLFFNINRSLSKKRYAAQLERQVRQRTNELEESRRYFSSIFQNAHDPILIIRSENEIVLDANQRACEIYGFKRDEFIGMSLEKVTKDVGRGKGKIRETLQIDTTMNFETVQFRKNGEEMFLEINASVINFKGENVILSINRDVTERKRAEQQVKSSLQEKEVLLKEIHHRVKNNLQIISSLLDLQSDSLEDQQILRVFQNSKNRIRSMALIHENLYQSEDLARINMPRYIHDLTGYLLGVYGPLMQSVTPILRVDDISLGIDIAIPIGLILTELFSNSLKYAFPQGWKGEIHIRLQRAADELSMFFKDNGAGLPAGVDIYSPHSLGLQLVRLLTQQLKGNLEFKGNQGASFIFTFPCSPGHPDGKEKGAETWK